MSILGEISFGLDIIMVDVVPIMGPNGAMWGIVFMAKGVLIGPEHYVANLTVTGNPWCTDSELKKLLQGGCESIRERRAQQMNGKVK
jgi:hypothetical protein